MTLPDRVEILIELITSPLSQIHFITFRTRPNIPIISRSHLGRRDSRLSFPRAGNIRDTSLNSSARDYARLPSLLCITRPSSARDHIRLLTCNQFTKYYLINSKHLLCKSHVLEESSAPFGRRLSQSAPGSPQSSRPIGPPSCGS